MSMEIKTRMNETLLEGLARPEGNKAVVLYSGGVESTASGLVLKQQGYDVFPLMIDYGQNALEAEAYLARRSSEKMKLQPLHMVKTDLLSQLTKSALLGGNALDDDNAWVPGRNTLFMVIAGIYASQIDADNISIGYMLDDNFVFGDNDYFHHREMGGLLAKSLLRPMEVLMPLRSKTKKDLIKMLRSADLLELTTSCWNARLDKKSGKVVDCQSCANCIERNNQIAEVTK